MSPISKSDGAQGRGPKGLGDPRETLVAVSQPGPREGTTGGGLGRGAHHVAVDRPSQVPAPECKASAEKKRASGQAGKKRKFIRGK